MLKDQESKTEIKSVTTAYVFKEYCEKGRSQKALSTIRKQDSLWNNHIEKQFGNRFINYISVAEVNDYLADLYYNQGYSFGYVESFIKLFYLLFGQAYSRNYLDIDTYSKLCVVKPGRISMPKRKIDDEDDVIVFSKSEIKQMDNYFSGSNAETAYLLGKHCGLRIAECYGLLWRDVDFKTGTINIRQQLLYQSGVYMLAPLKTKAARRTIYMSKAMKQHMQTAYDIIQQASVDQAEVRAQKEFTVYHQNGEAVSSLDFVNTLPNGKAQTINSMKYHSRTLQGTYDINFKYHYLRHTFGTRLAELNTPAHILCKQMGHTGIKITNKYYLGNTKSGILILQKNLNKL